MQRRLLIRAAAALAGGALGLAVAPAPTAAAPNGLADRLARYLATRPGHAAVAVLDERTGREYAVHPRRQQLTASIVKVEILEALLHREGALSRGERVEAQAMIERSDNDAAQALWQRVGAAAGLSRFGRIAGLKHTEPAAGHGPGYPWGLTLTTPTDQLRLLGLLVTRNPVLTRPQRTVVLRLMRHVSADQRWGVSAGAGASTVALKDGWLPLREGTTDWQINSIGAVYAGRRCRYLIAVITVGSATMDDGVATVEGVSRRVARDLR